MPRDERFTDVNFLATNLPLCYCPHFVEEETEAPNGREPRSGSHSQEEAELGLDPTSASFQTPRVSRGLLGSWVNRPEPVHVRSPEIRGRSRPCLAPSGWGARGPERTRAVPGHRVASSRVPARSPS